MYSSIDTNQSIAFDDDSRPIIATFDHPIDHIEPQELPELENEEQLAVALGISNAIFHVLGEHTSHTRHLAINGRLYQIFTMLESANTTAKSHECLAN